jgi:putative Holliday junction resolvase
MGCNSVMAGPLVPGLDPGINPAISPLKEMRGSSPRMTFLRVTKGDTKDQAGTLNQAMELEDLAKRLKPKDRLMGLDLGSKTIGVAVSDLTRQIASPLITIRRSKFSADAAELLSLAAHENVVAFILGLPVNMDGNEGPRAQSTRAFARNLAKLSPLPLIFWDERLSTTAVERMLVESNRSRARRAEIVDKLAAAYILQGALDRLARLS